MTDAAWTAIGAMGVAGINAWLTWSMKRRVIEVASTVVEQTRKIDEAANNAADAAKKSDGKLGQLVDALITSSARKDTLVEHLATTAAGPPAPGGRRVDDAKPAAKPAEDTPS